MVEIGRKKSKYLIMEQKDDHPLFKKQQQQQTKNSHQQFSKIYFMGTPTGARQDRQHLGSTGMRVQFLARNSGLRIRCCRSWGLDLIPGPGAPYAMGQPKKKKKRKIILWMQV